MEAHDDILGVKEMSDSLQASKENDAFIQTQLSPSQMTTSFAVTTQKNSCFADEQYAIKSNYLMF